MICGYRRTGKDTLYNQLNNVGDISFNWHVYYRPDSEMAEIFGKGPHPAIINEILAPGSRFAFADRLKQDVQGQLREAGIIFDYEAEKDTREFSFQGNLTTYRQMCIDHGAKMRELDKDYWCRIVTDQIGTDNAIITDFRFPNEHTFVANYAATNKLPLVTIRVFRKEVPIPTLSEPSEHSLDTFQTDLLLVRDEKDFEEACKLFPQYQDYKC